MLEIFNLYKSFGEQKVLQGINMTIEKGKVYTLLGSNGSGKTTLFNLITGFLFPDKGHISFNNHRIDHVSASSINARGITRTFQEMRIINQLSVKENILLAFKYNPGEKILNALLPRWFYRSDYYGFEMKAEKIIDKIHLGAVKHCPASDISYGEQKLLTLGCVLANEADLHLLDEPVAGLDKDNFLRICNLILQMKNEGRTILQIEHNRDFIEKTSDGIFFLNTGQTKFYNNYQSMISDHEVQINYMK